MAKNIDWEAAINVRKSTRNYEQRHVDEKSMSDLAGFMRDLDVPFKHDVKVRFFKADPDLRLYNNIKRAPPDNMAFMASTDIRSVSTAGFVGEMAILYATSLGIDTCWFGHYSLAGLERAMPHLGEHAAAPSLPKWGYGSGVVPGERAICVSPLGYRSTEGIRLMDRMTGSLMSYKRKPVGALLEGGISEQGLPPELLYAFDLARKAPSGGNTQHWRFTASPDFKMVSIARPVGYRHFKWEHPDVDIGICACHFWLGLSMKNISCEVSLSEEGGRAIWEFQL